jgi:hypothetical protein
MLGREKNHNQWFTKNIRKNQSRDQCILLGLKSFHIKHSKNLHTN